MKRAYDTLFDFAIDTEDSTYQMAFGSDWRYTDMLDFMIDKYSIDVDSIIEIRITFIKRFKVIK